MPPASTESPQGDPPAGTANRVPRWEVVAVLLATATTIGIGLVLIAQGAPLGHDEAVYALRGRFYAEGGPATAWENYRAEGLPVLFAAVWPFVHSEPFLRAVVLASGGGLVVLTWWLGRQLVDGRVGVVAAALLAVTPGLLRFSWQISLDVPSALLGLATASVLLAAICHGRVTNLAWACVPLAAAATFVRYGAPVVVASGMTAVTLVRWRVALASRWRVLSIAVATLGVMLLVLLVPGVTNSGGSPGLAFRQRQVDKELGPFSSWLDFGELLPGVVGWPVGIALALGIAASLVAAVRHPSLRRGLLGAATGGMSFWVVLNVGLAEGAAQYLVPMLPWCAIVAAIGLVWLSSRGPRPVVVGLAAVLGLAAPLAAFSDGIDATDTHRRSYGTIRAMSRAIGQDAAGGPCVVLTSYSPQVAWYSGCVARAVPVEEVTPEREALLISAAERFGDDLPADAPVYVAYVNRGKRQPDEAVQAQVLSHGPTTSLGDADEGAFRHGRFARIGEVGEVDGG